MTKQEWRRHLKEQRARLSPEQLQGLSYDICRQLLSCPALQTAACALAYLAFGREISLEPLFLACPDKIWGIPRCLPDRQLAWHRYHRGDALAPNPWGIPEPLPTAPLLDPGLAECILVPALGCDHSGIRLGYGQGFYDRFLLQVPGLRLAVIPDQALVPQLPRDPWDVPMQMIVTESRIVRI
ncbi:MAG: 5-formyltetrahydrofolate cyclo-ligase [Thermostichales cyanobacterium DRC_bins_46]